MNEGAPITWMWMAIPIIGLVINFAWPRKHSFKVIGIIVLLLTAYLHGFSGLNPLDRAIGLSERIVVGEQDGTPDQIVSNLRIGQKVAHQTIFDVSFGLTLAVVSALMPVDILERLRSRSNLRTASENK